MDLFTIADGLEEQELHPKFRLLQDSFTFQGEQRVLREWINGFEDRDGKILKEFQTTFHSSLWEFYLYSVFKEIGLSIDFSKSRPDFIVIEPFCFVVEAVVSEIKKGGTGESERGLDDVLGNIQPLHKDPKFSEIIDEAICRHSNSIQSKVRKYAKYLECPWVDESTPYVVALGSYDQLAYGKESHYSLFALLYGYYFTPETGHYEKREEITKPGTASKIPINIFDSEGFRDISAVVFSCTVTMGKLTSLAKSLGYSQLDLNYVLNIRHDNDWPHYKVQEVSQGNPEELTDGLFVFHNPNAKNKLPSKIFAKTNAIQVTFEENGLSLLGENCPIVARLNLPKMFVPSLTREMLLAEIHQKFNT